MYDKKIPTRAVIKIPTHLRDLVRMEITFGDFVDAYRIEASTLSKLKKIVTKIYDRKEILRFSVRFLTENKHYEIAKFSTLNDFLNFKVYIKAVNDNKEKQLKQTKEEIGLWVSQSGN